MPMTQLMPLCTTATPRRQAWPGVSLLLVMVAKEVKDTARQATYRYFMYSSFTL